MPATRITSPTPEPGSRGIRRPLTRRTNAYQLVESLRIDYGHLGPFGIHP
jgi:hypothetical protein